MIRIASSSCAREDLCEPKRVSFRRVTERLGISRVGRGPSRPGDHSETGFHSCSIERGRLLAVSAGLRLGKCKAGPSDPTGRAVVS